MDYSVYGTNVYVVEKHSDVLLIWEKENTRIMKLITVDYHTDTMEAFRAATWSEEMQHDELREKLIEVSKGKLNKKIVNALSHDEHIDLALIKKMFLQVIIFSKMENSGRTENIEVVCVSFDEDLSNKAIVDRVQKLLQEEVCFGLDIDLDFFNCYYQFEKSKDILKQLIVRASFITIATEKECYDSFKSEMVDCSPLCLKENCNYYYEEVKGKKYTSSGDCNCHCNFQNADLLIKLIDFIENCLYRKICLSSARSN